MIYSDILLIYYVYGIVRVILQFIKCENNVIAVFLLAILQMQLQLLIFIDC